MLLMQACNHKAKVKKFGSEARSSLIWWCLGLKFNDLVC